MNDYKYEDINLKMRKSFEVTITQRMMDDFKSITGDTNPLHCDKDYAKAEGYSACVAYGMLTSSFLSTLAGVYLPGKYSLIHSIETKLLKPVFVGDILTIEGEVSEKHDVFKILVLKVSMRNQHGEKVLKGKMQIGVL